MFREWFVRIVSVERSMKLENRGLDEEENMTDLKEREANEERQARLVYLCRCLHILVMALYIGWLGEERIIEIYVQSSEKHQVRQYLT